MYAEGESKLPKVPVEIQVFGIGHCVAVWLCD